MALFDLLDSGWVPPGEVVQEKVNSDALKDVTLPGKRPAPMEVEFSETAISMAKGGSLVPSDANTRAEIGWQALREYRLDFAASFQIGNYAPLPSRLASFDRAMGAEYDPSRAILIGVQARRIVALSLDSEFIASLPDGVAADLRNFASELLTYLNRFPDWVEYRIDAEIISPESVRDVALHFEALRDAIENTPEATPDVKEEYASEVAQAMDIAASKVEATALVATTGELARKGAEYENDLRKKQEARRALAKRGGDFYDKTFRGPLGLPGHFMLRVEEPMRNFSKKYPERFGWIETWYDLTFGPRDARD